VKRVVFDAPMASMLGRLRNVSPDARTVEHLISLVQSKLSSEIAPGLVGYGRGLLDTGYPDEQLHADLMRAYRGLRELGDEELEDAFLDAIDSLTGWWCPPGAALYAANEKNPSTHSGVKGTTPAAF
jgi:hypothetical protein